MQVVERATLTIEPGVTVKFNDSLSLNIGGELIARGTAIDSIVFTSNSLIPQPGDWVSIGFFDGSTDAVLDSTDNYVNGCILEYCRIEYGENSHPQYEKGAINCDHASPFISHCAIMYNGIPDYGGGIVCYYSSATISNSYITGNSGSRGGGICCRWCPSLTITGNVVSENYTTQDGGGIFCAYSSVTITDNCVSENSASHYASGIYCDACSYLVISGNTIRDNFGSFCGGGIYITEMVDEGVANITDNTIKDNFAVSFGGGIYFEGSYTHNLSTTIANNIIEGNSVSGNNYSSGGGIDCSCVYGSPVSSFVITSNVIRDNYAAKNGGGICCRNEANPTIGNNTITENSTLGKGGSIYCSYRSSPHIIFNTMTDNSGSTCGGIYCYESSLPTINFNSLVNQGRYEIYLENLSDDIDATNNWWRTTNIDSIGAKIWDYYDDMALGKVVYDPFLTSPLNSGLDSIYLVVLKSDSTYTTDLTANLEVGAKMFIQLEGKDSDSISINLTTVTITSSLTDTISIRIALKETDTTSGIFRGTALIDSASIEGVSIGATAGEIITITSDVDSTKFTTVKVGSPGIREEKDSLIPTQFMLSQNFPNPFNPTTEIGYALPRDTQVRLEVYNLLGQKVATLVDEYERAGYRSVHWDARGFASGVYLYRLKAGNFRAVKKLVVIK